MVRTGGAIKKKAGALSAGMLIKDLGKHIHPEGRKKLIAGGLFDKLAKIINVANTAYSVVNKAIPIVTKGVSTYKSFKTAYDGMKKGGDLDTSGAVTGDMVIMAKPKRRGGKLTAGAMPTAGAKLLSGSAESSAFVSSHSGCPLRCEICESLDS